MQIACIGSREIPSESVNACREIGMGLVRAGYTIVTGATPGTPGQDEWADWADGAFASGAYYAHPARLIVCLPWQRFPRGSASAPPGIRVRYVEEHPDWEEAASRYWEAERASTAGPWAGIRRATRLLYVRSAGVVLQARLVLAWPHGDAEETRFAMGFAAWRGVPVIDLDVAPWREALAALVAYATSGVSSNGGDEAERRVLQ